MPPVLTLACPLFCNVYHSKIFTIYDTSFEDELVVFDQKGGETEYISDDDKSGDRAVRISNYSEDRTAPRIHLSEVSKEARSEISVWVKPELSQGSVSLKLLLFTQDETGEEKAYTFIFTVDKLQTSIYKLFGKNLRYLVKSLCYSFVLTLHYQIEKNY